MSGNRKGRHSGGLAPQTLALLRFVRQHPQIGTWDAFSQFEGAGESFKRFSHRLQNLRGAGWLLNDGHRSRGLWRTTMPANSLLAGVPLPAAQGNSEAPAPCPLVPPRQFDVMGAPAYRPAPVAYRAGAFDHAACSSCIGSRAVAFWAEVPAPALPREEAA